MSGELCTAHPEVAAEYHCDSCDRMLCEACIDVGHRLLFCAHCGERALPLEENAAVDAVELSRQRVERSVYTLPEALAYPFRGLGRFVLWASFAVLGAFAVIEALMPLSSLMLLIPRLLIFVLIPGLMFAIVRTTAAGETELPDWPDLFDGERLREFVIAVILGIFTVTPAIVLVGVTGCDAVALLIGLRCWVSIVVGLGVGFLIWIPAFAAMAHYGSAWLSLRLDLHVHAFVVTAGETAKVAVLILGLVIVGQLLGLLLLLVPLLGGLVVLWIDLYALFVGSHLIGLLLRKHQHDLEAIYCH